MVYYRRTTRSRRSSRGRRSAPVRKTIWLRYGVELGTAATAQSVAADLVPNTALDRGALVGSTVTRVHCKATFFAPVASGVLAYNAIIGIGMAVLPVDPTIQPGPITSGNQVPWFFHDYVHPIDPSGLVDPATTSSNLLIGRVWDVKSSRIINQPDETIKVVVQPQNCSITAVRFDYSMLLKLA